APIIRSASAGIIAVVAKPERPQIAAKRSRKRARPVTRFIRALPPCRSRQAMRIAVNRATSVFKRGAVEQVLRTKPLVYVQDTSTAHSRQWYGPKVESNRP